MVEVYIPDVGDIVWLDFDPQTGHEQAGNRPAVVLSPKAYNSKTSLMVCCPVSTKIKGYPFEVSIAGNIANVALSDQVKSLDWRKRKAKFKGKVSTLELQEIRQKIAVLLGV
ncbi:endoribonuclease MazF [Lonepinella koalarum]|uniref:mRNA interferase MazF n=1 Tax=Lonepinella koalarum TaxID=53417 RepID=A0A4R1KPM5_9PAST|nr:endoribonuclease MazF [Lonepinella koalarum]MDH2926609.1 toxin MazF [Lonepinella koalarum]TCK66928.1 mRNA interferase MazF [Lonepinella koalarum]TFJ88785.1 endoribonuclease MazF [Lonepinella koalarum]